MSEEQDANEAAKCHGFGPPKSLQGMKNADVLWKMITKRFPNAAPLLCEMEAVIDRADNLLRQLRAPYNRSMETSSLNNFMDSEESDKVISLICDEPFPDDTDVFEDVAVSTNTAETQISESSISTIDTDFNSIEKSNNSQDDLYYEEHRKENNSNQIIGSRSENPSSNLNVDSFESWGKFVDSRKSECEKIDEPCTTNEQEEFPTKPKKTVVTKVFERTQQKRKEHSCGDWDNNVKENNSSMGDTLQEKYKCKNINETDNKVLPAVVDKNESEIPGDSNVPREIDCKTAWDILEEYAERCNVKIEYHCEKNKCNRYVITGKLTEFSATGCGDNEELAKSSIAKKILQNVADHQMNDNKMKQLLELSREQILEILNFENDETIETPLRKLYMFCVQEGSPPPKYITEMVYRHEGVKCVAKCMAMGHVVEGHGVSRYNAKKAAAEQFYQKYGPDKT
ncbi:hypothetical protein KPH14_010521 [Odynerus spinipes]|uniref:Uncharacterized protein n=1 Tax=Odynerus spinipes TaxID=1348599 RepID=A0AAD9RUP7_9HYME|nr:hypothetical protein KPH14_010521 [Odynerus spinipes]